jgi:NADPH2:quinone reductase
MMRAFQIGEIGTEPELRQLPVPEPRQGEALVRIAACGLNFADQLMISGSYQERPPLPLTLGMELAGRIEALGPGTSGPAPGTRVAVFAGSGGLADAGCFPAARCLPLPEDMSEIEAAGFQVAYSTSHVALAHRARLAPGETLVVFGAAGGVGLTAVEIGRLMGATVIAVARGPEKLAVAEAAGAHHLIDSGTADLKAALKALGGIDVAYDPVGGAGFRAAVSAARPEARLLTIGFASGEVPQIPANHLLVKNLTVIGLYWGGYLRFRPEVIDDSLRTLFGWYREGKLRPYVSHVLPLDRAGEALALLRERRATGKVVVTMA